MISKKITTSLITAGVIVAGFAPVAFAETSVTVDGTGAFSSNNVTINDSNTTVVDQSSKTVANTTTVVNQETGGNSANFNTGAGNVDVTSGPATSGVTTTVTGGDNAAVVPTCGCENGNTTVSVKGTGAFSYNKVKVSTGSTTVVTQKSTTKANTTTVVTQKTGNNSASFNTGSGTKTVTSGGTTSGVTTTVSGGSNWLNWLMGTL